MLNNSVIAEFMGLKKHIGEDQQVFYDIITGKTLNNRIKIENLKYHSHWESLMPVVQKILDYEYLDVSDDEVFARPHLRTFGMKDDDTGFYMVRFNRCRLFIAETLIEATYLAVIDFITWYNSINPKQ